MIFSDRQCNLPQPIFAAWFLTQFRRWGMVKGAPDYAALSKRVMRPDIYLEAMKEMGLSVKPVMLDKIPLVDSTLEGADPERYAKSFAVHSLA